MSSIIKAVASYIPQKLVTNEDLSKIVDTNDQWITERTGIKTRYIAENEENSDLASKVGKKVINKANLKLTDVDCLIVATCTPDQPNPATACIVAQKMNLQNIPAFDINAMCTGFLYALQIAQGWIDSGMYKNILVIGSEKLSDIINWNDRSTCIIFGDGAGAVIVGKQENDSGHKIIETYISSDGSQSHLLGVEGKISSSQPLYLQMKGKETYKHAVTNLTNSCKNVLNKHGFTMKDIDWFVPHQANLRILKTVADRCGLPMEKVTTIIDRYGNTSSASIPMAMTDYEDRFQEGNLLLCPAFGGGLTYGATLIRW